MNLPYFSDHFVDLWENFILQALLRSEVVLDLFSTGLPNRPLRIEVVSHDVHLA